MSSGPARAPIYASRFNCTIISSAPGLVVLLLLLVLSLAACAAPVGAPQAGAASTPGPEMQPPPMGTSQTVALVRGTSLLLGDSANPETIEEVTRCERQHCRLLHLTWSPAGDELLFLDADYATGRVMVAGSSGEPRTLADGVNPTFAPAWSPDGTQVAFVIDTHEIMPGAGNPGNEERVEVWVVDAAGGTPEKRGDIGFGTGCGGMLAFDQQLYEAEGFGYTGTRLAWSASDILLYTRNCGGAGIGRFDMASGEMIEPFSPTTLRGAILDDTGARWAGVDDSVIVTGDPTTTEYEVIWTSEPVNAVTFGREPGTFYYVTRRPRDESRQHFESALWRYDAGTDQHEELWRAGDFGFARVTEDAAGDLLFVAIEHDSRGAFEAMTSGASGKEVNALMPHKRVMRLSPAGTVALFASDAGLVAVGVE
jgi:hypothetical protein